jgi:5-methylcytosine-specific restriction endonuclease McrA
MMKSLINQMRLENKKNKRRDKIRAAKLKQKQNKSANQLSQEFKQSKVRGIHTASDAFLMTYEWRKVRMEALKKYGARCQCCGATPAHGAVMNVDHIKPRKLYPHLALDLNNLQVLCHDCNHGKGNWDMTDWRERNESPIQLDLRDVSIKVF